MAAFARDLLTHKVYRAANGGDKKTLEKLLSDERRKNPKRIPYFFSACKKTPGKFALAYQPGHKPFLEIFSLTPDGYRYRNKVHSSVDALISWFKAHYRDPVPRPIPTISQSTTAAVSSQGSQYHHHHHHHHIPPHQSALASPLSSHSVQSGGSTPYTPQWPNATPTPTHYGGGSGGQTFSQPSQHYSGYTTGGYQHYHGGGGGGGGGAAQYRHEGSGYHQQRGWAQPAWSSQPFTRTPGHATPGRTPAYTPTQTPGSFTSSSLAATPHLKRTPGSPLGTPLLDE